jgi:hypothetical protein
MDQEIIKVFVYDVWCAVVYTWLIVLILEYADMLQTIWNELDYPVDVCDITKGAHIEHL